MQVELLYHTPDPERAIATAARLCYACLLYTSCSPP